MKLPIPDLELQKRRRTFLAGILCLGVTVFSLTACRSLDLPLVSGNRPRVSPSPVAYLVAKEGGQVVPQSMGNPPGPILTIAPLPDGDFLAGVGPIGDVETGFEWRLYRGRDDRWERLAWPPEAIPRSLHAAPAGDLLFVVPRSDALFGRGQAWGLMRSADGGRSWQQALNGLDDPYVMGLAFSPVRPALLPELEASPISVITPTVISPQHTPQAQPGSVVQPGAEEPGLDGNTYTMFAVTWYSGVYRSTDAGETWEAMLPDGTRMEPSGGANPHDLAVAVSPDYDDASGAGMLIASFSRGLHRLDAGAGAWQTIPLTVTAAVKDFDPPEAQLAAGAIAFSPAFTLDNTIYLYSGYAGIFRSSDRGQTWHLSSRRLDLPPPFVRNFYLAAASTDEVYVLLDSEETDPALNLPVRILYRSQDGGRSWETLRDPPTLGWVSAFALSRDEAGQVTLHLGGSRGDITSRPADVLSWK